MKMLYIQNDFTNSYFNQAVEEYFMKNTSEECFMLWRNEPCVFIGKNQNAIAEINIDFVKENNVRVNRRYSGGGAVFHDLGNINFTFLTNKVENEGIDFRKFTLPIINALRELGINAEFSGRNDITIEGKKFSGNAQYYWKDRVLHHGTLLFSGNLTNLSAALNPKPIKFEDKSVKSVASRVTNISEHLPAPMTVWEFRDFLQSHFMKINGIEKAYEMSGDEIKAIQKLVDEKYTTWEWIFGNSPKYSFDNTKRFAGGTVEINMEVDKGVIKAIRIYGDFFGERDVKELEEALTGVKHSEEEIRETLANYDIGKYIANVTLEDILSGLF
jgi:lipoate---protein ligase